MKELSIKEKAKAYDEALERAKKWYNAPNIDKMPTYGNRIIEEIFPELIEPEDEDERIRKALINVFATHKDYEIFFGVSVEDIRAWLEKQKIDKEINLAEILKHYPKETELYSPLYGKLWLAEVDEKNEIIICYKHPLEEGCTRAILPQEDTVAFFSDGTTGLPDFNVSKDCVLFLYDIEKQSEENLAWSNKDEEVLLKMMFAFKARVFPSSEECDSFIDFLKSLKNKVRPKQEWSEEDEERIKNILSVLDAQVCWHGATGKKGNPYQKEIDWLKSLRPQKQWKPSEKQMEALHDMNLTGNISYTGQGQALIDLYKDLKKLREE